MPHAYSESRNKNIKIINCYYSTNAQMHGESYHTNQANFHIKNNKWRTAAEPIKIEREKEKKSAKEEEHLHDDQPSWHVLKVSSSLPSPGTDCHQRQLSAVKFPRFRDHEEKIKHGDESVPKAKNKQAKL